MRGDRLRDTRIQRGLSQKDLADRVGVSDQQVYRYENERSDPTAEVLSRLARELEVSMDYLAGLVDQPTAKLREEELSPEERELIAAYRRGDWRLALRLIEASPTSLRDDPSG